MRVKLEDIVNKIVGDEDRETTKLEFYVGGEHIESESITVKKRGVLDSDKRRTLGYQFHYPFQKGDTLFMTKNPYLKKCGKVDFDGICSVATFVLRTKDQNILSEDYLPIITQTEDFWNYMESHKSGSVNYFITWKTLGSYEFELPSLSEQKKLAETLWSIVATMESYKKLLAKTDEMVKAKFVEMFGDNNISTVKLSNECELITKGTTPTTLGFEYLNEGINFIKIENIDETGHFLMDNIMHIGTDCNIKMKRSELKKDDILFSIAGAIGRTAIVNENILPANINQALSIIRLKENSVLSNRFLRAALVSDFIRKQYMKKQRGIAQINLSLEDVSNLKVPIPSFELQKEYVNFVQKSEESKSAIQASLDSLIQVYKKIITENLGGNE